MQADVSGGGIDGAVLAGYVTGGIISASTRNWWQNTRFCVTTGEP
ncbi:hypothetical protein RQN30_08280 [Arcanobacterium hippocoleae]